MIPAVIMKWFVTNPRNVWAFVGLIAVVGLLLTVYLRGRHDAHARDEARQKIAVAEAIKSDNKADAKAIETVQHDAIVIAAKEKELADAVAKVPDTVPDAVAVARGCVELQQNHISTADIPACSAPNR